MRIVRESNFGTLCRDKDDQHWVFLAPTGEHWLTVFDPDYRLDFSEEMTSFVLSAIQACNQAGRVSQANDMALRIGESIFGFDVRRKIFELEHKIEGTSAPLKAGQEEADEQLEKNVDVPEPEDTVTAENVIYLNMYRDPRDD